MTSLEEDKRVALVEYVAHLTAKDYNATGTPRLSSFRVFAFSVLRIFTAWRFQLGVFGFAGPQSIQRTRPSLPTWHHTTPTV